ncbi:MAG: hypothetical protein KBF74_05130, partial [Ferruginibacter sp.]|nr:hypothetical protein [Ferruginibacter sp.]
MKQFKSIILFFALAFAFISAGAQNVSINVLTQNSGQVNIGGTVFVQITIANTSTVTSVPNYKLRPQLSVPVSIVSIPATGHILPAGWSIISNASGVIRVSNGTDQIPPSTSRDIFIAIQGNTLGGPQTVSGNLLFSNGVAPGSASGPATSGDQPGDNSSSSTVEVIQGPACSIAVSASAGTIACNGGTTTLTATATGASGSVEYSLNGGAFQPGNTFTVNAAGSPYTVTAREVATPACTATSAAVTVSEPSAISASASAGSIACNGGTTTLTVTATGGTGSLQYSLSGGAFQGGNTFTVNAAGSPYIVTVQDANNCTVTTSAITVSEPLALSATATSTPVTTTGGSDGTATALPVGGTSPYSYLWTPGNQTTITATGLMAGNYSVLVTDFNGCTATANTTVGSPACTIA